MQDEVNEKTMALCIKGGKISAQILKAALTKLLAEIEKKKQQSKKMGGQNRCKRGKQSIKSLQQSGAQLTNIVVTDNNIKSFDRVARKYGVDYSLKKAEKEGKTEYLVFFKAKDVDVMTAAFKEYTGVSLKKEQRQSIRKKLEQATISLEQVETYEHQYQVAVQKQEDAYIEKKKILSEKLVALQDSIRTEKEEQECADELDEEIRALTKQASEKTYIGGLTKECVDAFVSMVYLYDDQTIHSLQWER